MKRIRVTASARAWSPEEAAELRDGSHSRSHTLVHNKRHPHPFLPLSAELRGLQAKHHQVQVDAAAKLQHVQRARAARELAWLAAVAASWNAAVVLQRHARGALWRQRVRRAVHDAERELEHAAARFRGSTLAMRSVTASCSLNRGDGGAARASDSSVTARRFRGRRRVDHWR